MFSVVIYYPIYQNESIRPTVDRYDPGNAKSSKRCYQKLFFSVGPSGPEAPVGPVLPAQRGASHVELHGEIRRFPAFRKSRSP